MKKVYFLPIFLFVFFLTGCQEINNEDGSVEQEQEIVEKITEVENSDVIGETESNTANVNEEERQEGAEEDVTEISVTWQDAYKNIIRNIQSNLADPYNFMSEFGFNGYAYVGIHDFDKNDIPELIIGSSTSVAVFAYEEGKAEKVADLYETEDWGGINYLCYKDNHLVLMSCGNGENAGNGYVCFTYEQGEYITGFYDDYQPDEATINGEPVSKEEFLLQFDVLKLKENNHIEFNWRNSAIAYCKVNDEDEIMLAGSDEWIAIDDLDFSLIEWPPVEQKNKYYIEEGEVIDTDEAKYGKIKQEHEEFQDQNGSNYFYYDIECFYFDPAYPVILNETLQTFYDSKKEAYRHDSETYMDEEYRDAPNVPFNNLIFQGITYAGDDYVSLLFNDVDYEGGAHPYSVLDGITIDCSTGEIVTVDRFIDDTDEEIGEQIGAVSGAVYNPEEWDYYITDRTVVFFYHDPRFWTSVATKRVR